ncbi:hypothetical protein ACH35V_31505 [Actinomadura sp. 1N219]|uniref:hypothetical protein n=1 Tax=Actinomadura sp. 1N219 TaxID=3375152 RepID=UPI0037BB55D9
MPVQSAAADGPKESQPRDLVSGPSYKLGHSKINAPARRSAAADHTITLRAVDLDGIAKAPLASLVDLATGTEYLLTESGTTLTGVVPAGDYSLTGIVLTGNPFSPSDLALYGNPTLTVAGDVDLTLDAATATEIHSVSPSATATEVHSHAQIIQTIAGQELSATVSGNPEATLRAWPSASTTRPYHFIYAESKTEPLNTLPSPRAYKLAFPTTGSVPANLTFTAAESSLALVNTTYGSQGVPSDGTGAHSTIIDFDGIGGTPIGLSNVPNAGSVQRVYYTAGGVQWIGGSYVYNVGSVQVPENRLGVRTYTAGSTSSEVWNKAAFGPTTSVGHGQGTLIFRPLVTDTGQPGHDNYSGNNSTGTTGTITLYRNGVQVGVSTNPLAGDWTVPAASATYQLRMVTQRTTAWSKYAKSINARWTFTSAERPGDPFDNQFRLLQPRITGAYDTSGRAPSGTTFPLDVAVQRAAGGSAVTSLSLQASFNDGSTWVTVPLTANGTDRWTANVAHPLTHNGFVALRFNASDGSGNSVQQTVTRAYGLR